LATKKSVIRIDRAKGKAFTRGLAVFRFQPTELNLRVQYQKSTVHGAGQRLALPHEICREMMCNSGKLPFFYLLGKVQILDAL
jgi:hypothetical protein